VVLILVVCVSRHLGKTSRLAAIHGARHCCFQQCPREFNRARRRLPAQQRGSVREIRERHSADGKPEHGVSFSMGNVILFHKSMIVSVYEFSLATQRRVPGRGDPKLSTSPDFSFQQP